VAIGSSLNGVMAMMNRPSLWLDLPILSRRPVDQMDRPGNRLAFGPGRHDESPRDDWLSRLPDVQQAAMSHRD